MTPPFALIDRLIARDGAAAMVSVIGAKGSTPREAGARMVVSADGAISGTIGGGRLEQEAINQAVRLLSERRDDFRLSRFALGPALGQCCGGHVTVGIDIFTEARRDEIAELTDAERAGVFATEAEVVEGEPLHRRIIGPSEKPAGSDLSRDGHLTEVFGRRRRKLYLFGAGHVGRALVVALAPLPVDVVWIDERADMFPAVSPGNVYKLTTTTPEQVAATAEPGSFLIVMTHDHDVDLRIIHQTARRDDLGYVGLIGSATKRARFESRLKALGIPEPKNTEFRCPIGVPGIKSKEPALIAVSVAAELMVVDEALSSRAIPADLVSAAVA